MPPLINLRSSSAAREGYASLAALPEHARNSDDEALSELAAMGDVIADLWQPAPAGPGGALAVATATPAATGLVAAMAVDEAARHEAAHKRSGRPAALGAIQGAVTNMAASLASSHDWARPGAEPKPIARAAPALAGVGASGGGLGGEREPAAAELLLRRSRDGGLQQRDGAPRAPRAENPPTRPAPTERAAAAAGKPVRGGSNPLVLGAVIGSVVAALVVLVATFAAPQNPVLVAPQAQQGGLTNSQVKVLAVQPGGLQLRLAAGTLAFVAIGEPLPDGRILLSTNPAAQGFEAGPSSGAASAGAGPARPTLQTSPGASAPAVPTVAPKASP